MYSNTSISDDVRGGGDSETDRPDKLPLMDISVNLNTLEGKEKVRDNVINLPDVTQILTQTQEGGINTAAGGFQEQFNLHF